MSHGMRLMKIQFIFFPDKGDPLFEPAADKFRLLVGEIGFRAAGPGLNLQPAAAFPASGQVAASLHHPQVRVKICTHISTGRACQGKRRLRRLSPLP